MDARTLAVPERTAVVIRLFVLFALVVQLFGWLPGAPPARAAQRDDSIAAEASPLINEVMFWPVEGDTAWVELHNPTDSAVDLTDMRLTNGALDHSAALPAVNMPPDSYLVVHFGRGANDLDLADGRGAYSDASAPASFLNPDGDAVALYAGSPGAESIVDFFAWSYWPDYQGQAAYEHAVAAGIWLDGEHFDAQQRDGLNLSHPVMRGETVGRDRAATDSDTSADWSIFGGADAYFESPGAVNYHETFYAEGDALPDASSRTLAQRQPAKKKWTLMAYYDGRDPKLAGSFVADIDDMEASGSNADVNVVAQLVWRDGNGSLTGSRWHLQTDADRTKINSPRTALGAGNALNPGDPAALKEFITWAKTNYPAERYAIVLGGHGRGWKGVMLDDANIPTDDFLTMAELSAGLGALGKGKKFEVVEFEACFMGMVEVGYQIADRAKMMVASEEIMWTALPWQDFVDELKANLGWDAGQYADRKAQLNARGHRDDSKAAANDFYTMASIDLAGVKSLVRGPLDRFSALLRADMEELKAHDVYRDNHQVVIKHGAQERAEDFADTNYKDLRHFAQLVWQLPVKSAGAAAVVANSLKPGGPVIRWHESGPSNDNANGLSIYFPHDLLLPDEDITGPAAQYPASPTNIMTVDAFADPLGDPLFTDTHLYQRDALILIPDLRNVPHPMADDPGFEFPLRSGWDEFLHRYYKPVADACIRLNGCVLEATVYVGDSVTLSGNGSSDSDGPEDAVVGGSGNDVPAHTTTAVKHYYWDFDVTQDNPAPKPDYKEHVLYTECGIEDCDRDDKDEPDDDRDAVGKLVGYTCKDVGTHRIRLMVWDEHHDHDSVGQEDPTHNLGRHWLHFNVDAAEVVVHCVEAPMPVPPVPPLPPIEPPLPPQIPDWPAISSSADQVSPGEEFAYRVTVPAGQDILDAAVASVFDPLPEEVRFVTLLACSAGACSYDPTTHTVQLQDAPVAPGDVVTLEFAVRVDALPPADGHGAHSIENCAGVNDGAGEHEVCVTTELIVESEPPPTDREAVATGRKDRRAARSPSGSVGQRSVTASKAAAL